MDFVIGLPRSFRGNDSIWVIVDRFSKIAHFLVMKKKQSVESLTHLYIENIVKTAWSSKVYHFRSRPLFHVKTLARIAECF